MSTTPGTKESELVMAVLLYAIRCLAEGDQHALRGMNFGPKEVAALREVNLADLYRAGSLRAHCLHIQLNRNVYWPMLAHLRREREIEEIQRDLIQADAPMEMMRRLFGVGPREYSQLRRLLAVGPAVGRPPEPDEAASHELWRAWQECTRDDPTRPLTAEDYLMICEASGVSMRAVWRVIEHWAETGDLSHSCSAADTDQDATDEAC